LNTGKEKYHLPEVDSLTIRIRAEINDYLAKTKTAQAATGKFGENLKRLGRIAGKVLVGAFIALTAALTKLFMGFIKAGKEVEKYRTILTQLYGSAQKANDVLEYMLKLQIKTPYNPKDLIEASLAMEKFGLDAKKFVPLIGDASAAMGADGERMSENAQAFARAYRVGAAGMRQLRFQFGITMEMLAEAAGTTADELRGNLPKFQEALVAYFQQEKFVGGMEKLAATFGGVLSSLGGIWTDFQMKVGKQIDEMMKTEFKALLDWLLELYEAGKLQEWADGLADAFQVFWDALGGAEGIKPLIETLMGNVLPNLARIIGGTLGKALNLLIRLLNMLLPHVVTLLDSLLPPLMEIVELILPVLTDILDALMPIITDLIKFIMPILVTTLKALMPLLELVTPVLELIYALLDPILTLLSEAINFVMPYIAKGIELMVKGLETLIGWIKEAIEWIVNLFRTPEQEATAVAKKAVKDIGMGAAAGAAAGIGGTTTKLPPTAPAADKGKGGEAAERTLREVFPSAWLALKQFDVVAAGPIAGLQALGEATDEAMKKAEDAIKRLEDVVMGFGRVVNDVLGAGFRAVTDSMLDSLRVTVNEGSTLAKKFFGSIWNALLDLVKKIISSALLQLAVQLVAALIPGGQAAAAVAGGGFSGLDFLGKALGMGGLFQTPLGDAFARKEGRDIFRLLGEGMIQLAPAGISPDMLRPINVNLIAKGTPAQALTAMIDIEEQAPRQLRRQAGRARKRSQDYEDRT
jgi:predicted phage tail protein